jgi:hypothetical protein
MGAIMMWCRRQLERDDNLARTCVHTQRESFPENGFFVADEKRFEREHVIGAVIVGENDFCRAESSACLSTAVRDDTIKECLLADLAKL